jgi:hypothetical protein
MQPSSAERPAFTAILAVVSAIAGFVGLYGGVEILRLGSDAASRFGSFHDLIGLGLLVVAVGNLAFAAGLWTLRSWAWPFGVVVEIVYVVFTVLWATQGGGIGNVIVSVIVAAINLWYLDRPKIRTVFGRSPDSVAARLRNP